VVGVRFAKQEDEIVIGNNELLITKPIMALSTIFENG
jgi:hypothetical protein